MKQRPRRTRREPTDFLSRALARAGVMPLREAEDAIRAGRVSLNGERVQQPMMALRPGDRVRLDGHPASLSAVTLAVMLHKPAGCVATAKDPEGRATVFDALAAALPESLRRYGWHAIGRLDVDTTGLLLFTNDEHLVEHVTTPGTKLGKRYLATVQGELTQAALEPLRRGLKLDDGQTAPARARLRAPNEVELVLTEGRFHQVKRMLGAVGLPVRALHREAIGGVELDVPLGLVRQLSAGEVRDGLSYEPRAFHG